MAVYIIFVKIIYAIMDFLKILTDQKDELDNVNVTKLIKRKEEADIHLDSQLAQVVIGVRRCGKSTLCKKVLIESGVIFGYINFDDERLVDLKASHFDELLQALYRINGKITHLFLDEVQNIPRWELFVNRMLRQGLRLIVTGSNANLLSGELTTHLAGRYHEIKLFPFSFTEFCMLKGIDTSSHSTKAQALRMRALDRYMTIGGMPEIVDGIADRDYAESLLHTIVYKDVCHRYKIRYTETIWKLANVVLDRFCQEMLSTKLAAELRIKSHHTVDNYLKYIADAYLICMVNKFSWKSPDRRRTPKAYAIDLAFVAHHEGALQSEALGWKLENIVAIELLNRNDKKSDRLYYIKEYRNYEVDFVVVKDNRITELIQVTYDFTNPSVKQYNREVGGLIKGSEATNCDNLTLIIMQGEERDIQVNGKIVHVRLACDWLISASHIPGIRREQAAREIPQL